MAVMYIQTPHGYDNEFCTYLKPELCSSRCALHCNNAHIYIIMSVVYIWYSRQSKRPLKTYGGIAHPNGLDICMIVYAHVCVHMCVCVCVHASVKCMR